MNYFKGMQYMNQHNSQHNKNMKYPNSQKGLFRAPFTQISEFLKFKSIFCATKKTLESS